MTRPAPAPASAPVAWLRRASCFAVLAFVWWRISENTADNDLWGHVLYGQRMLHFGGLETTETLSWTAYGASWINHEVLAELALGLVHSLAGGTGLWLLMVVLATLTIGLAWRDGTGADRGCHAIALALLALCTNAIALGYAARPQLFTYCFFVILLVALRGIFTGRQAWAWVLPPLFVIWVNTHGGFLAGWLFAMIALVGETVAGLFPALLQRFRCEPLSINPARPAVLILFCTLALVVTPWGWHLAIWTVGTVMLPRPDIYEWQQMPLTASSLPFFAAIAFGALAWIFSRRTRRSWEMLAWALLAAMSVQHQRHAPLFGLASLVFLPVHLQDALARLAAHTTSLRTALRHPVAAGGTALALFAAGAACLYASVTPPRRFPFRMEVPRNLFPVAALEYLRTHQLTGNTVTFFDWGQQVLWELPDNPVSFDGRLDTVYSVRVMGAHWQLYAGEDPGPALELSRAQVALLPTGGGGVRWLRTHGWKIVYEDALATVLIPSTAPVVPVWDNAEATIGSVPFPDAPAVLATRAARTTATP
jgi:hypothetical protein